MLRVMVLMVLMGMLNYLILIQFILFVINTVLIVLMITIMIRARTRPEWDEEEENEANLTMVDMLTDGVSSQVTSQPHISSLLTKIKTFAVCVLLSAVSNVSTTHHHLM